MKKILAAVLTVCLFWCLAACEKEQPAPFLPEPSLPVETQEEKTLVYWSMWTPEEPQAEIIQEAAADYEKETGNKIQIEWKGRGISREILPALEAGEHIDLFDEDYMRTSKNYARELLDLEELAAEVGYDSFAIAALPESVRGWAGSLVTIPYQPYTSGIFYNREAFETAGIVCAPETWDELMEACQSLKEAGYVPFALDDAYVCYFLGFHLARYLTQDGVSRLVAEGNWSESPQALRAAEELAALRGKGYLASNAPSPYPQGQNEIGYGRAAMVVGPSWIPGEVERATGNLVSWGMFNYPTVPGGEDPSSIQNVGAQSLSIPINSPNAEEAFAFIMKLASGEYDRKFSERCASIPADTRNTQWPLLIEGCRESFDSLVNIYEWNCGLDANKSVEQALQINTTKLFDGRMTAAQFIAAMDQENHREINPVLE